MTSLSSGRKMPAFCLKLSQIHFQHILSNLILTNQLTATDRLIIVAARSKTLTVFALSNAGIVGLNPTQGMDVCIVCAYSVFVLFCVYAEALRWAESRPRSPTNCV
jgi:ABC-type enterochelin transport system permease subunit